MTMPQIPERAVPRTPDRPIRPGGQETIRQTYATPPSCKTVTKSKTPGTSKAWSSRRVSETVRLIRLQRSAGHLGLLNSPYFPTDIAGHAQHLQAMQRSQVEAAEEKIHLRMLELRARDDRGELIKFGPFLNGKTLENRRHDKLGWRQEKVWPFGMAKEASNDRVFDWPTYLEGKVEGQYRAMKGMDRRLPVPKRRVDQAMGARLLRVGVPAVVVGNLLVAREDVVEMMVRDALARFCGLDEVGWKYREAEMIMAEPPVDRSRRPVRYQWNVSWRTSSRGDIQFDEDDLSKCGMWEEILCELNKPCI